MKRKMIPDKVKKRKKAKIQFNEECRRMFVNITCVTCGVKWHIRVNDKEVWDNVDTDNYKCILCKSGIKPEKNNDKIKTNNNNIGKTRNIRKTVTVVSVIKNCLLNKIISSDKIYEELIKNFPNEDSKKLKRRIKGCVQYLKDKGEV